MKFKVLKGTKLHAELGKLWEEMCAANKAANDLINRLGYDSYRPSGLCIAGGISSVYVPSGKPKGWKNAFKDHQPDEYMPSFKGETKELADEIKNLPVVYPRNLNELVGWGTEGFSHPAFLYDEEMALIDFSGLSRMDRFSKKKDMIEILSSEYDGLYTSLSIKQGFSIKER